MIHHLLPEGGSDRDRTGFSAADFHPPSTRMDASRITLTARYPEPGYFALNTETEMVVTVLEGATIFWCEGEQARLAAGSIVFVEPNKKYYWLPEESVTISTVGSPPWTPEQHRKIPE